MSTWPETAIWLPHGSGLRYSESGAIVPIDPAGDAAEREREASRRAQRQAEAEIRAVEAAAVAEHERARDEAAPARAAAALAPGVRMSVEALERALEDKMFRKLAEHECSACGAALALGLDVAEATATRHTFDDLERGDPTATLGLVVMGASPDDPESMRRLAVATLMAKLEEDAPGWPLAWPLPIAPGYGDEADFCRAVKAAGLDRRGYRELLEQAYALWQTPLYERLHEAITDALEEHGTPRSKSRCARSRRSAKGSRWSI